MAFLGWLRSWRERRIHPAEKVRPPTVEWAEGAASLLRQLVSQDNTVGERVETSLDAALPTILASPDIEVARDIVLRALTEAPQGFARKRAARVLGVVGGHGALEALMRALRIDSASWVRKEAAVSLARLAEPTACRALLYALSDKDEGVRAAARNSLGIVDSRWYLRTEVIEAVKTLPYDLLASASKDLAWAIQLCVPSWSETALASSHRSAAFAGLLNHEQHHKSVAMLDAFYPGWETAARANGMVERLVNALDARSVNALGGLSVSKLLDRIEPKWREGEAALKRLDELHRRLEGSFEPRLALEPLRALRNPASIGPILGFAAKGGRWQADALSVLDHIDMRWPLAPDALAILPTVARRRQGSPADGTDQLTSVLLRFHDIRVISPLIRDLDGPYADKVVSHIEAILRSFANTISSADLVTLGSTGPAVLRYTEIVGRDSDGSAVTVDRKREIDTSVIRKLASTELRRREA